MDIIKLMQRRIKRENEARLQAEEIGEVKLFELYNLNTTLQDLNNELKNSLKAQKDITKKIEDQKKVLEKETLKTKTALYEKNLLEAILESSSKYAIVAFDLKGKIFVWNEGAKNIFGYNREEVFNKTIFEFLVPSDQMDIRLLRQFLKRVIVEDRAEEVLTRRCKDGSLIYALVSLHKLFDAKKNHIGYVGISKDITHEKEIEDKLINTNKQLEEFAYVVSHDLKAPLRAISQLATWLKEDNKKKLDLPSQTKLDLLVSRCQKMTHMIEGILEYSRIGQTEIPLEDVDVKELLDEICQTLNLRNEDIFKFQGKFPKLRAAKILLTQVFSNLISNSLKHSKGKKVNVKISVKELKKFYKFSVEDNGPGISPNDYKKIFEIFKTLDAEKEVESTGIGLSIVKKIVESQGGEVTVESELNKGAKFSFTWPKSKKPITRENSGDGEAG